MSEEEKKGFKVVDRRGVEKEETGKEESASPPPPRGDAGNRAAPESVQGGKSPGVETSPVGGPSFLDLVLSVQMGAMVNLGMVQAGDGRRSPVNLPAAKDSIDLLDILKEKTKGNLTEEESGVLSEGLYHLRMTYVAAVKAGVSAPKAGQGPEGERK
jgi:hypothetical protein